MVNSAPKLRRSCSSDIPFSQPVLGQSNVRPVLDDAGKETGTFEVPAGGRRFRALELLVRSKRMAKDQAVPCVVREGGSAEEEIAARFYVTPQFAYL